MSEQIWYLYQNGQQLGPFEKAQVVQLHSSKMIAQDAYVFKVGWKEWRPIEEIAAELGIGSGQAMNTSSEALDRRRATAPRATVTGSVIVHNNGQLTIGKGVNISASGMFVESADRIFTVGERLKVTVRCNGLKSPFNAVAEVIRFNGEPPYPVGYGFRFEGLTTEVQTEIQRLVDDQRGTGTGNNVIQAFRS